MKAERQLTGYQRTSAERWRLGGLIDPEQTLDGYPESSQT